MNIAGLRTQLAAVEKSTPIAHQLERAGRMAYFPDLDGVPEWLTGSFVSYPTEGRALAAARERKDFLASRIKATIEEMEAQA